MGRLTVRYVGLYAIVVNRRSLWSSRVSTVASHTAGDYYIDIDQVLNSSNSKAEQLSIDRLRFDPLNAVLHILMKVKIMSGHDQLRALKH